MESLKILKKIKGYKNIDIISTISLAIIFIIFIMSIVLKLTPLTIFLMSSVGLLFMLRNMAEEPITEIKIVKDIFTYTFNFKLRNIIKHYLEIDILADIIEQEVKKIKNEESLIDELEIGEKEIIEIGSEYLENLKEDLRKMVSLVIKLTPALCLTDLSNDEERYLKIKLLKETQDDFILQVSEDDLRYIQYVLYRVGTIVEVKSSRKIYVITGGKNEEFVTSKSLRLNKFLKIITLK